MITESPNSQRPDESNSEPLSCSSADLPDLQSGSLSDDGSVQNEKDDNPFTILRVIPSPEKTTTFQFRSKCQRKKKNRKSKKATSKQLTTTNDSSLSRQLFGDQDCVLLDEATARNTLYQACASDLAALQKEALISVLEIEELALRNTVHEQSSPVVQLISGEQLLREAILSDAKRFIANAHAQTYLNHHPEVLQKSSTAYAQLLLLQLEEFEDTCRKQIRHDHETSFYKSFGPNNISTNRRVLGFTIKSNQKDQPFSAAWRKMALLNTNGQPLYDPFKHTEATQTNFLRTQGMLPGPSITQYPAKVKSSRSWYDITEQDPPPADFADDSPITTVRTKTQLALPSIDLQTPWSQDTTLEESIIAWTTTWGENVKRNIFEVQQMVEIADLFADSLQKNFFQHLSDLLQFFMDCDIQKWHAIISFIPENTCTCSSCSDTPDLR